MSLVLIAIAMATGPLATLWPRLRPLTPWRRECGIYAVLLAIAHTIIILAGWVEWDFLRLFGYEIHPITGEYVMSLHGFGLANIIGIVALLYGIVLAGSSNNVSLRFLGGSVWKFVQQGSYVLWMLALLHTAYFLYLHFQHYHRPPPEPNWAQGPFASLVAIVAILQMSAFLKTWIVRQSHHGAALGNKPDTSV